MLLSSFKRKSDKMKREKFKYVGWIYINVNLNIFIQFLAGYTYNIKKLITWDTFIPSSLSQDYIAFLDPVFVEGAVSGLSMQYIWL